MPTNKRVLGKYTALKTSRRAQALALIVLLLASAALANWTGIVSFGQKKGTKTKDGMMSPQSFNPASPSKEYIYVGNKLIATEEPPSSCSGSILPQNASFTSTGGTGNVVAVTAGPTCSWSAQSNDTWIIITAGAMGTGNGQVTYTVSPNNGGNRSGTITIAQQTFYVMQDASSCSAGFSLPYKSFTAAGGSDSVGIVADAGCPWNLTTNVSWVHLTPPTSGSGSGSVSYQVDANTGSSPRQGVINMDQGPQFTIFQSGNSGGCTYSLSPVSASLSASAGTYTFNVSTNPSSCSWSATTSASWVHTSSSGTGNGTVTYTVDANPSGKRNAVITVANIKNFNIVQSANSGGGGGGCTGTGTGLYGEYFNFSGGSPDQRLCGTLGLTRTDSAIDFTWPGSPGAGINADSFHVRWTGQVEAPETANYIFSVRADDGVKLWVNNQVLVDKWYAQSGMTWSNTIQLTAGQKYDIRLEMYDDTGGAEAHLWWQRPSQVTREIIPQCRLYPHNPASQPLYEGSLDAVDCTTLTGWAFNRRSPNTAISVAIYADGSQTPLATVSANQLRQDLVNANYTCDNGLHGFSWTIPSSLKNGQPHTIDVKYSGTSISLWSSPEILTCSTGSGVPSAPTNVDANVVTSSQVVVVWQYSGSITPNGFIVQRSTDGAAYIDAHDEQSSSSRSWTDTGLAGGHQYCYQVRAYNMIGRSSASNSDCVTLQAGSLPPSVPKDLHGNYVATPTRHVDLTWTDSTGEDSYGILRRSRLTSGNKWTSYTRINTTGANITSYTDSSSLAPEYTYGYVVQAVNASGGSPFSNEVQIPIPAGSNPSCVAVNAYSGTGGGGSYDYVEGSGANARWRSPSAGVTGIDPVSGLNVLFVADTENHAIRMIYLEGPATGVSIRIAGNGTAGYANGDSYQARFNYPQGIAAIKNQSGVVQALLVADTDNKVIRQLLPPLGRDRWRVSLFSGKPGVSGFVDGAPLLNRFNSPRGIAVGLDGLIYVADTANKAVRFLNDEGYSATWYKDEIQSTFQPVGIAFNQITGEMYITDQGYHRLSSLSEGTLITLAGSGSAGFADDVGTLAAFNTPYHLGWTDSSSGGWIYVADLNNSRLRVFDFKTNAVSTWAGTGAFGYVNSTCSGSQFNLLSGIAFGAANEIYVIEKGNNAIRKVQ